MIKGNIFATCTVAIMLILAVVSSSCSNPSSGEGGETADPAALDTAITAATTNQTTTGVGESVGMVSQDVMDAYVAAIFVAQQVSDSATSQADVDAAIVTLAAATDVFNAAKIKNIDSGEAPAALAEAPTEPSSSVISLYTSSATYTNVAIDNWNPNWGQKSSLVDATVAGGTVKLLNLIDYQGVDFDKNRIDISGKNTLRFSYYTSNGTDLAVYPINADTEYSIDVGTITTDSWVGVELVIDKEGFDLSTLRQLKFVGSGTYYLDNIYFYGNPAIPVISLLGESKITLYVGESYTEKGAKALDDVDGDISTSIVIGGDTVDTTTAGTYIITYNVNDSDENAAAELTRTVIVKQPLPDPAGPATTPPDLTDAVVIYSDKKATDARNVNFLAEWSSNGTQREFEITKGENVIEYEVTSRGGPGPDGSAVFGIEMDALDVSTESSIYMNVFVQGDIDLFKIKFVSPDNGMPAGYAAMLDDTGSIITATGSWISIDIPLANIPMAPGAAGTVDWGKLIQIVFITYGPESTVDEDTRFLLDNLYFY